MGPLSQAVHAHASKVAPAYQSGLYPKVLELAAGVRRQWWDDLARSFAGARTTSFGVSSTGLRLLWRVKGRGSPLEASMDLHTVVEAQAPVYRHTSMVTALLEKVKPQDIGGAVLNSYQMGLFAAPTLLERCDALGVTFFEDSFAALESHLSRVDVRTRRRGIDRDEAMGEMRKALAKFLDNGGDAETLKVLVDEAIVERVMDS